MWISCKERLPPFNQKVLAWMEGSKEHSNCNWKRFGYAFMVRHDDPPHTVADSWARSFYEEAIKDIGADLASVTHWMPLPDRPADTESPFQALAEAGARFETAMQRLGY
jgi:hypothetical protein